MPTYGRDPNALSVLKNFMGRSNVAKIPTSVLPDAQGYGDMLPGADSPELKIAQEQIAKETGMGFSRDALRGNVLDSLRKQLGLQDIEHQQTMERVTAPQEIQGRYGVEAARVKGIADAETQNRYDQRQQALFGQQRKLQEDSQAATRGLKEDFPASGATTIPNQLYAGVTKARGEMPTNALTKWWKGGQANSNLEGALTALLDRKGTLSDLNDPALLGMLQNAPGATIDERINNAGQSGLQQLDPYERQYLQLKLGL